MREGLGRDGRGNIEEWRGGGGREVKVQLREEMEYDPHTRDGVDSTLQPCGGNLHSLTVVYTCK